MVVAAPPGLDPRTAQAYGYLHEQGCHFVLVGDVVKKVPIHERWQLPWATPSLEQVLRHLAQGRPVGHVPAAVGCVVLDVDESDDGGKVFMDRHPPFWDIPSSRAGGLHLYYLSRVQYGNGNWRMGGTGGQIRSRNGFVMIWDPFALADLLAHRSMMVVSPEDLPFPAIALGAKSQVPRDYGMRTPPPRRQGQARRLPRPPSPVTAAAPAGAPARRPEVQDIRQPEEWVLRDPPAHLRWVRAPNPALGIPGARNCELFDSIRFFAYPLPRGRGGPAMYALWRRFLLQYARLCNDQYAAPLSDGDVEKTARSVAKFTWLNPSFGRPADPGRHDPQEQRRRSRLGVLARQRKVLDRNRRIAAMHRDGRSNRAIARETGLSPPQVGRIVRAEQLRPGAFHNPITSVDAEPGSGAELGVDYENRNGRAADSVDETQQEQPEIEPERLTISPKSDETMPLPAIEATPVVDNSAGGVDNLLSPWEEALLEGAGRRAAESRRWVERERRLWMDRGPPED